MDILAQVILILTGSAVLLVALLFAVPSFRRNEIRAGYMGLLGALAGVALISAGVLPSPTARIVAIGVALVWIVAVIAFLIPIGRMQRTHERPTARVDERTIVFARRRLKPSTPAYEAYYRDHPEHKDPDEAMRSLPGLLSPKSPMADPLAFAATDAGFFLAEALREAVDGTAAPARHAISPESASQYIKHLAKFFGARNSGIAQVKDYHVYSHIGRGSGEYGQPITLDHPYAIVFTFEMAEEMVRAAPRAAEVMETARQYSEAAQTAVQIAAWIRALGYEARAHIDGNYRLILPLVARDAGLGEIGRMGLLMTPDLGPRVRLGAVTTTLPLVPDTPGDSAAVLDFCQICKKCAHNCPSRAIPTDDRRETGGALRWKISAEKCFHYWNTIGTDCGRCMMVCPYSHADDPAHTLVRWLIARSGVARRAALYLDDVIYRRLPRSRPAPSWMQDNR